MSFVSIRGAIWLFLVSLFVYTFFAYTAYALLIKIVTVVYTVYYFMWAQSEAIKNDPAYMVKLAFKLEETQQKYAKKCAKKLHKQETDVNVNDE